MRKQLPLLLAGSVMLGVVAVPSAAQAQSAGIPSVGTDFGIDVVVSSHLLEEVERITVPEYTY